MYVRCVTIVYDYVNFNTSRYREQGTERVHSPYVYYWLTLQFSRQTPTPKHHITAYKNNIHMSSSGIINSSTTGTTLSVNAIDGLGGLIKGWTLTDTRATVTFSNNPLFDCTLGGIYHYKIKVPGSIVDVKPTSNTGFIKYVGKDMVIPNTVLVEAHIPPFSSVKGGIIIDYTPKLEQS